MYIAQGVRKALYRTTGDETVPKATGPGSYAPGFHEGSRSEYLAQYVFSALGPALRFLIRRIMALTCTAR